MQYPSKERVSSVEVILNVLSAKKLDEQISQIASEGIRKNQVYNLCYGVARRYHQLGEYINSKAKKKVGKKTFVILQLGLFELAYNNSSKPYAVISEALKLMDHFEESNAKPFVNAVLSNFTRNFSEEKNKLEQFPLYPGYITQEARAVFGKDADNVLKGFLEPSPFFILVNENRTSVNELYKKLTENKIEANIVEYSGVKTISTFDREIFRSKEFESGSFIIQDLSSQYAVSRLEPFEGMSMLDLCSAPGGKAIKAAIMAKDKASIKAVDRSAARLLRMHENINRLSMKSIEVLNSSASEIGVDKASYDRVFVDPPCSALGVLRRNPDIIMRESSNNWEKLPEIQMDILSTGLNALKKGGLLVYSVCTFRRAETSDVINRVLSVNHDINKKFECLTLPNSVNMDGLYIAVLERK